MNQGLTPADRLACEQFRDRLSVLTERIDDVTESLNGFDGYVAVAGHIDVQIAAFFAEYIAWELDHVDLTKEMLMANELFTDDNRGPVSTTDVSTGEANGHERFRFHIDYELSSSMSLLDQAQGRLDTDIQWPTVPEINWNEIVFDNGYFRLDGRPVFSGGFNIMARSLIDAARYPDWVEKDKQLIGSFLKNMRNLGVGILSTHVRVLDLILEDGSVDATMVDDIAERIRSFGKLGFKVDVMFGWQTESDNVERVWPGITEFYGNFLDIDIDHPGSRVLIDRVMAAVMPTLRDLPEIISWDMANEPFFSPDLWSHHSLQKYHLWLAQRYPNIDDLNRVWRTEHAGFQAIPLPKEIPQRKCSPGEWYDRITFHNERVASFFDYFQKQIRRYIPDAVIHLKGQDNSSLGPRPEAVSEGIDREMLTPLSNMQGVDTRPLPVTEPRMAARALGDTLSQKLGYDESIYGFHWLGQSFLYDYLTSLEPQQNVVDFEYHAFSINAIRIPDIPQSHPRATLWLAHLHGLISNMTWYWHRRYGPCPAPNNRYKMWFYGSISTQPLIASEYFQTLLKLNMFAEEVEALATTSSRPLRILVSKPSYIQNQAHINALHRVYEGSCFHGFRIGFVTERRLSTNGVPEDCRMIIIPDIEYMSEEALSALRNAHESGVQLVRFGELMIASDPYGNPHPDESLAFLQDVPAIGYTSAPELSRQLEPYITPLTDGVAVDVINGVGAFGIMHRCAQVKTGTVILMVNVSESSVTVKIRRKEGATVDGFDILNGQPVDCNSVEIPFQGVRLVRI